MFAVTGNDASLDVTNSLEGADPNASVLYRHSIVCGGCTEYAPVGMNAYAITLLPPETFALLAFDVR